MIETVLLRTAAESATEAAGSSLARSLHAIPVTIGLSGALGTGKTAFMRGFLRALGVSDAVTSPTYALEQRYPSPKGEVLHIDLYRLNESEASALLSQSDHHPGIRCVEWPEKSPGMTTDIDVAISENADGSRSISIECRDVSWPDDATIAAWRAELRLPPNVGAHCDAIGEFCAEAATEMVARGTFIRPHFVRAAGKVHDLLRFADFKPGAAPAGHADPPEDVAIWNAWKNAHANIRTHEEAVGEFLREHGYRELGHLAESHSVHVPMERRTTTEEHLLYYADKRFVGPKQVTIAERYADMAVRYGNGQPSPDQLRWEQDSRDTEKLLFPDGPPL